MLMTPPRLLGFHVIQVFHEFSTGTVTEVARRPVATHIARRHNGKLLLLKVPWRQSRDLGPPSSDILEVRKLFELAVPIVDVGAANGLQPPGAEVLDAERSQGTPEDDGLPESIIGQGLSARQIAEETAREGVPCPGGVEHRLQRVSGRGETVTLVE